MARSLDDVLGDIHKSLARSVKLGSVDLRGMLRTQSVSLDAFPHLVQHGVEPGYSPGVPGQPAAHGRIDLDGRHRSPWDLAAPLFLMDLLQPDGSAHPACTRGALRRVANALADKGMRAQVSTRLGFTVFAAGQADAQAAGFRNLAPAHAASSPGSWVPDANANRFLRQLMGDLDDHDIRVDVMASGPHPGTFVATLKPAAPLEAADQAVLFKTVVRSSARNSGMSATFMARVQANVPHSPGHFCVSLWNSDQTENLCVSETGGPALVLQQFMAGVVEHIPTFMPLLAPTTNGYGWMPEHLDLPALRVRLPRAGQAISAMHGLEAMVGSSDLHPYTAIASLLAMGMQGVERTLEVPSSVVRDGEVPRRHLDLPATLDEALGRLRMSLVAKNVFGSGTVDALLHAGREELDASRRAVTDHELLRHFETA